MKRKLVMLLAGIMLMTQLTGCGSGKETDSTKEGKETSGTASENADMDEISGKITMWTWFDISDEIEAYEESHPGTEIEQVVVDAGEYMTKIQTTLASGGTLPDLVWGESLNRGQLFAMDILDDLKAEPYNLDTSLVEQSVLPTMIDEEGRTVGLERNINPSGLAYKRDLAKEYLGTDDPDKLTEMITSWDEFINIGETVKEKSGGKVSMLTSLGDVYYIANGQSQEQRIKDGTIQTEVVKDLFTEVCEFRDAGIVSQIEQWTPAWYASFGGKDSIFSPMPSFGLDNFIIPNDPEGEGNWGLIVPPEGGFNWGGTCWGITKDSENKALAWDFVKFDSFEEGADIRYGNGEIPSGAGYMDEEKVSEENTYFSGQKIGEVFINEILPTIYINPITEYDYTDICTIELVLSSLNADYEMTADDAVDLYISEMQDQAADLKVN